MSGPLGFLANNAHLAHKANTCFRLETPKFRFNKITSENQDVNKKSEILDLDCTRMQQRPVLFCFGSTLEIGSNFRNAQLE